MLARCTPSLKVLLTTVTVLFVARLAAGSRDSTYVETSDDTIATEMNVFHDTLAEPPPITTAKRDTGEEEDEDVKPGAIVNTDRITCLRQDDLDLVVPHTDEQVVRMVIGMSDTSTAQDVYVSASDIQIKKVTAIAKLRRLGKDMFIFEITGEEVYNGENVASVEFWVAGIDVLLKNTWMDWGASFATDRSRLNQGQDGSLKFKITGQGKAVWNATTMDYDIKITSKEAHPFKFYIQNQMVLEKVLNNFGGIDQTIMNALWPAVIGALPKNLVAAFTFLNQDELSPEVIVRITGGSQKVKTDEPLKLDLGISFQFDTLPAKLLSVFKNNFPVENAEAVAQRRVTQLFDTMDIEALWKDNQRALMNALGRYGLKPEFLDKPFNKTALKDAMIKTVTEKAGAFTMALQPFIDLGSNAQGNMFQGLTSDVHLVGGWKRKDGLLYLVDSAKAAGEEVAVALPKVLVDMLGVNKSLKIPPPGSVTSISHQDLVFKAPSLSLKSLNLQDVRVKTGGVNGTPAQTWKLAGTVKDIDVKLPKTWDPGYKIAWARANASLLPSGNMVVETKGLEVNELPTLAEPVKLNATVHSIWAAAGRSGDTLELDGKVPPQLSRPLQPKVEIGWKGLIPAMALTADLRITGAGSRLTINVSAGAIAEVDLRDTLKSMLAPRPAVDFGYIFFADKFERHIILGESEPEYSTTIAVVSCGYLRLLNIGLKEATKENPLMRLDMNPEDALRQMQLDLTKYDSAPELEQINTPGSSYKFCVNLYTSGYPVRQVSHWLSNSAVKERLCGPEEKVRALLEALDVQVRRFHSNTLKARDWNYGTHLANETHFLVPQGWVPRSLTSIMQGMPSDLGMGFTAWGSSS